MGVPAARHPPPGGQIFGDTVDFVLKNAPCRVMVAAAAERPHETLPRRSSTIFGVCRDRHRDRAHRPDRARQGGGVGYLIGVALHRRSAQGASTCSDAGRATAVTSGRGAEDPRAAARPRRAARSSRSPTARSPRRSTSRSGSSPCTRSGSRPRCSRSSAALFLVVALSYAEGTTAIPETGGAATFVRRAFNDLAGFLTGWALFLDYLIVIALSALFVPHYLGAAHAVGVARAQPVGRGRRRRRDRGRRARPARAALRLLPLRDRRRGARPRDPAAARRARLRLPLLRRRAHARRLDRHAPDLAPDRLRVAARDAAPTPASRPSRTSPRRRASPDATCRAASSRGSASSS